jgi:hypothetical protein
MRITRDSLVTTARETVKKRTLSDPSLVAAYLTGSLRSENPFLGNSTDIDIVFVHEQEPKLRREILPLTPEIHLDMRHNSRSEYEKPKELRVHPWLGPELYDPLPLHVTEHFFEFVQAGVRDKFHEVDSILERSKTLATSARQAWSDLQLSQAGGPEWLLAYLASIQLAANAVALLGGDPLAERRFLLQFPARAEACSHPELVPDLLNLVGAGQVDAARLAAFLPEWEKSFLQAASNPRIENRIAVPRLGYYKLACQSFLESETPQAAVWPLLLTWTISVCVLPPATRDRWQMFCDLLGLREDAHSHRLEMLDHFLDDIEEILEKGIDSQDVQGTGIPYS